MYGEYDSSLLLLLVVVVGKVEGVRKKAYLFVPAKGVQQRCLHCVDVELPRNLLGKSINESKLSRRFGTIILTTSKGFCDDDTGRS